MGQVKRGENLVTFTQPTGSIDSVKLTDSKGVIATLRELENSQYSLEGFPTGAYILDVIANLGSNQKGAYETILVILQNDQEPVQPEQVINQVK